MRRKKQLTSFDPIQQKTGWRVVRDGGRGKDRIARWLGMILHKVNCWSQGLNE